MNELNSYSSLTCYWIVARRFIEEGKFPSFSLTFSFFFFIYSLFSKELFLSGFIYVLICFFISSILSSISSAEKSLHSGSVKDRFLLTNSFVFEIGMLLISIRLPKSPSFKKYFLYLLLNQQIKYVMKIRKLSS